MSNQKLRLVLLALLSFMAVTFLATALFSKDLLNQKSQTMVGLKLETKNLETQLSSLSQSKKTVEQYAYFNDVAKTVLPNDKDQAQAVIDIFEMAKQSGLSLSSITFPSSNLSNKTGAADAKSADPKALISQAKPVEGIAGLYGVELIITPQIGTGVTADKLPTYGKLLDFLNRIERNRRTAQITQVNIQPTATENGRSQFINFTLTINIFIKP